MSFIFDYIQYLTGANTMVTENMPIGVQEFRIPGSISFKLYYPAAMTSHAKKTTWFQKKLGIFIAGYIQLSLPLLRLIPGMTWLLETFFNIVCYIMPHYYMNVPCLYQYVLADNTSKLPLLLFSHGLSGTSDEHKLFFVSLVQRGYIVAAPTHCDGSACIAIKENGEIQRFIDCNFDSDDHTNYRIEQVRVREKELYHIREHIANTESDFPESCRSAIDLTNVFVGGFSYGASTAALSAVLHPEDYSGALLIDGWFLIDMAEWKNIHKVDYRQNSSALFPPEVHENGIKIPACFIASAQLAQLKNLEGATYSLKSGKDHIDWHLLKDTMHQNFVDIGYWIPWSVARYFNAIGTADYNEIFRTTVNISVNFFQKNLKNKKHPFHVDNQLPIISKVQKINIKLISPGEAGRVFE